MSRAEWVWWVGRWLAGWWLLWRVAPVAVARARGHRPCSIVIPARNEAASLPTLLTALAPQRRPGDEVIVVDDDSSDATVDVAMAGGAEVYRAPPLAEGWTGKNAACWTGADAATNDVLVFLDADTQFEPGGLDRLLAAHQEQGGLLSVQPYHDVPRPYEQLSAFFNIVAMMGIDAFTARGARRAPSGAFGPVLITTAADYEAVGGHAAVKGEVLDDMALARSYTAAELPVACLAGRGTVRFRMYPDGLGQLVEGWTKNFAGGAAGTRKLTLLLVAAWVSLCVQAAFWVVALPWRSTSLLVVAATYLAVAGQLWWMLRRIGSFSRATALLFPLPLAAFLAVFVRSVVNIHVRHRVTWKGRELAT